MNFCQYLAFWFIVLIFVRSISLKNLIILSTVFLWNNKSERNCRILNRLVFLLKCLVFFGKCSQTSSGTTLRLVIVITRHGDRTPTSTFGNYSSCKLQFGDDCGQLTGEGMRQLFQLGQLLRSFHYQVSSLSNWRTLHHKCDMSNEI
jgi:hypothetical protein